MDLKSTLSEKRCNAEVLCSLSWKGLGRAAEVYGQQTGRERIEIARLKAKWLPAFAKINCENDSVRKGVETFYHCSW